MKKLISILTLFLCAPLFSLSIETVTLKEIKKTEAPVPSPKIKDWTVAVYMNGRSNIEPFALTDINRFETLGSDENINIVVELGRSKGIDNDTEEDGDWEGVRRYYVTKDDDLKKINSTLVEDLGPKDMGDWKNAAQFLKWVKENYPAKKTFFIIWDHGWGWIDPVKPGENLINSDKSISHDFVSGNYIKTTELSQIFKTAGTVDVYASMACFMQMAEVAYEIKDYAQIIIGSQEVIQLPSFNFEDFFLLLKNNPQSNPEKAASFLTETFLEMYSRPEYQELLASGGYGTQLSAIKGLALKEFAQIMKKYSAIIVSYKDEQALSKAKKEVLRFEVGDTSTDPEKLISFYGDIYHFTELLEKYSQNPQEKKAVNEILQSLKKLFKENLIVSNVYTGKDRVGIDFSNAHGLAVHIPGAEGNLIDYHKTYNALAFEKATSWSKAIKRLENIK